MCLNSNELDNVRIDEYHPTVFTCMNYDVQTYHDAFSETSYVHCVWYHLMTCARGFSMTSAIPRVAQSVIGRVSGIDDVMLLAHLTSGTVTGLSHHCHPRS